MSVPILCLGLSFLCCLFVSAVLFSILSRNDFLRSKGLPSSLSILGALIIGLIPVSLIFWHPYDFVAEISALQYFFPLILSILIAGALFFSKPFILPIVIITSSTLSVFLSGLHINLLPDFPTIINQLLTIVLLSVFALSWRGIAGLNPLPQIEGITVCIGIFFLYVFGSAPLIMATTASGLGATLIIAYLYSKSQPIGLNSAPLLGFIIGWLGLIAYNEYIISCYIIFIAFALLEIIISFTRYITLLPQYREIAYNSVSVQSFSSGLPAADTIRIIWNTNILLIILGLFQSHGSNIYSIPIFASIITAWQLYRMSNWQTASQTLKETNQELIKEVKKSFSKIFNQEQEKTSIDDSAKKTKKDKH